jgi:hypothetical protein
MQQQNERLMTQVREMNQAMVRQQAHQQLQQMGQEMEQATLRVREMVRNMERLHQDPEFTGSAERVRQMEQLQERIEGTMREMEQVQASLRAMIGQS